ncbi:monocarboxylate transporter 14-like, partial [Contarinia nasturtii]|uniref:monocarboxylate transporter 14-like n=1 Tax=Contarinia nasturtii TaxID=265458 RepID=UPI0012D4AB07
MENHHDIACSSQKSKKITKDSGKDEIYMDSCQSWIIVIAAFFSNAIIDGIIYTMGMIENELSVEFNESKVATSWVPSIVSGMPLLGGPIASHFIKKYNCRTVAIVGSILSVIGCLISAYALNITTTIITIGFVTGTGFSFIYLSELVSVTTNFEKYRSVATGLAASGTGFGTSTFAPLVAFFIENFGWRTTLLILGMIVLSCIIFGALFRQNKVPETNKSMNTDQNDNS